MKWYAALPFLFIIFALGGIVYLGANTDKITFGFGEPSFISKQVPITSSSPSQSNNPQYTQADKRICQQWQQELITIEVKKSLTDPRYLDYPEFQSLLRDEYNIGQNLQSRCR